jgi:hypothetical protein
VIKPAFAASLPALWDGFRAFAMNKQRFWSGGGMKIAVSVAKRFISHADTVKEQHKCR